MSKTNDERIKEMLTNEPVPQELKPENIKIMLDEKVSVKKRRNIKKTAARITAGAAACAVICGTSVYFAGQRDSLNKEKSSSDSENIKENFTKSPIFNNGDHDLTLNTQAAYMSGASGYEEVYQLYKKAEKKYSENERKFSDKAYGFDSADIAVDMETAAPMDAPMANGEAVPDATMAAVQEAPEVQPQENENEISLEPSMKPETPAEDESLPEPDTEPGVNDDGENKADHSDTYNQEEGVLEADIVKTDGEYIYYLYNSDEGSLEYDLGLSSYYNGMTAKLNIAGVEDGKFTSSRTIDISVAADYAFGDGYTNTGMYVSDMYLYNDMILVVGTVSGEAQQTVRDDMGAVDGLLKDLRIIEDDSYVLYSGKSAVFVSAYTAGDDPQLIDTYYQEGNYDDVRISPDGYMYLISDYTTQQLKYIDNEEQLDGYVPKCGVGSGSVFMPPEDILMPDEELEEGETFSCTVIGSIDLNNSGEITAVDSKALAGYTGEIYSSANNLYTTVGWDDTEITRIAISEGNITPAANGSVEGSIKDQFSMSEYGGYFRIATTNVEHEDVTEEYTWYDDKGEAHNESVVSHMMVKRDNGVYVLDMDLNQVGSITGFGEDESIKSVNFSGDTAYVVTYEQTDPLFAIDLSDPANPVIMDEFKILGYSTYMQQWQDGMLLGFGVSADEDGIEQGIKLTMFDNSDPYNLDALDTYEMNRGDDEWISSIAVWERKALLIAPEKNLIGVPIIRESWSNMESLSFESSYVFFAFEDGRFVYRGEIGGQIPDYSENDVLYRSVYVGDYVYTLCGNKFIAADINTLEVTDEISF